jgi:hypothetical protein
MRIFYDTEFVENGPDIPIKPVSFGFVREDGAELYVINGDALGAVTRHPWCSKFLLPSLPVKSEFQFIWEWDDKHDERRHVLPLDDLRDEVRQFLTEKPNTELWAYYPAYDHVVLSQLFGSMGELPAGMPMRTNDLQQLAEQHPLIPLPPEPETAHHALIDARWVKLAYDKIMDIQNAVEIGGVGPFITTIEAPQRAGLSNEPATPKSTEPVGRHSRDVIFDD